MKQYPSQNNLMLILKIIGLSILFIVIFHFFWNKIENFRSKRDIIRTQTEKYKKMFDEINTPQLPTKNDFISIEEKILMEYELQQIIGKEFNKT